MNSTRRRSRVNAVLPMVAAMERYSRHPLAAAIVQAAAEAGIRCRTSSGSAKRPASACAAQVGNVERADHEPCTRAALFELPPSQPTGLECVIVIDDQYAATFRFHDVPRAESRGFVGHLGPKHGFTRVLLVSGDREAEVQRLADAVAITDSCRDVAGREGSDRAAGDRRAKTLFIGDGINDAPALMAATVGIAFGQHSDVTSEAARVVIIDSSLSKVDELIHLSYRLRRVALESAVGGMLLSGVGMAFAAAGVLTPVAGAVAQEVIDLLAVLTPCARRVQPPG